MSHDKSASAKSLDIGFLSREYEPLRELGRGGMGWVVLARHRIARHEVAIKVSAPGVVPGGDALARLQREARVLSTLRHPNIVRLHDLVDVGRGRFAIVMEYVRGTSLAEVLREHGPIPFDRCRSILGDVSAALAHAHERGIVHRDVKPANVLLNRESWAAKLCDFGIARGVPGDVLVTSPEIISGTPAYMSPEQIDAKELDLRSDIFSTGLLAWEMLTGEQPWRGLALFDVLYRQKHAELTSVEKIRPETPASIALAIEGALAKDRAYRWANIGEMRAQLDSEEPTTRLLELRAERFNHELERKSKGEARGGDTPAQRRSPARDRLVVAGDPSAPPPVLVPAPSRPDSELPATVQMRVEGGRPFEAASGAPSPVGASPVTASTAQDATAALARPTLAGEQPTAATVRVPRLDQNVPVRTTDAVIADASPVAPSASRAPASPVQPAVPPPSAATALRDHEAEVASEAMQVVATRSPESPAASRTPDVMPPESEPLTAEPPVEVLREVRDRRTRGTLASAFAVLTAALLIWAISANTRGGGANRSRRSTETVSAGILADVPLPSLLPGVPATGGPAVEETRPSPTRRAKAALADSLQRDSIISLLTELALSRNVEDPARFLDRTVRTALFLEERLQFEEALRVLDTAVALLPREGKLYALRARVRQSRGDNREAWTDIELARRTGAQWDVLAVETSLARRQNGVADARRRLDAAVRAALVPPRPLEAREGAGIARALIVAGDAKTALGVLGRVRLPDPRLAALLDDPYFRPLAADPRFEQIRRQARGR